MKYLVLRGSKTVADFRFCGPRARQWHRMDLGGCSIPLWRTEALLVVTEHIPTRVRDRITQLRWETGPVIPQELQQSLSARERDLFNAYDGILTNYAEVNERSRQADGHLPGGSILD